MQSQINEYTVVADRIPELIWKHFYFVAFLIYVQISIKARQRPFPSIYFNIFLF